ncbi:MAG: acetyl ornithine aminotransferase family protein [Acidobacteria bacterium]|nr:acetyl ornithine aminotransferase family protein [Acidobacteriota bacterium]MCA1641203.1 acetyl ornithine aminotransferase family protein [Acidobacteriota bacterium]
MTTMAPPKRPEIKTALPGPKGQRIVSDDAQWVTPSYPRPSFKLVAERGEGVWVTDVDGNVFLDCNAGVAVCSTGHCHPEVVRAIQDQAAKLIHMCGTDYYYEHMPALARKLDEIVPVSSPTRTHFANSGTEAVETALKLAMHATGREKFIAFFNSFHGRTLGSLSLTSSKVAQRRGFKRQALDVVHVPYPNAFRDPFTGKKSDAATVSRQCLAWIEERLFKTTTPPEEVAGIVVECVQGEGGYVPAPKEFLHGLRRICDEHGIMLIVDEVQSGMGRTGKMFASEHYDLKPDIVTIAKGIGSGLPIGACVARADLMDWKPGAHASTFGGNPVCIAAALKTIELLENGLVKNSAEVGGYLKAGLEKLKAKHDSIGDVRGLGMMIGVEFVTDGETLAPDAEMRDRVEIECFNRGLIILGAGANTIRWSPPLTLTRENVDVALEIFDEAVTAARR